MKRRTKSSFVDELRSKKKAIFGGSDESVQTEEKYFEFQIAKNISKEADTGSVKVKTEAEKASSSVYY